VSNLSLLCPARPHCASSHSSRVPFFCYAREHSGSDGMRKSQRLAILQVLVNVPLGSSRSAVASIQLARASQAR
jgi:hypothetical protein